MTAAISAAHSSGSTMPVDDLPPNTSAIIVTDNMSTPFKPALPKPMMKAASKMSSQCDNGYSEKTEYNMGRKVKAVKLVKAFASFF